MSVIAHVNSPGEFASILRENTLVVADFYAEWCGPCKAIAPVYEKLAQNCEANSPRKVKFTRINTDEQKQLALNYKISAMPTFLLFRDGIEINRLQGADPQKLSDAVKNLGGNINNPTAAAATTTQTAESSSSNVNDTHWRGADMSRGFNDLADQVDIKDLDILNIDSDFGSARVLFDPAKPSALDTKRKGKEKIGEGKPDWVESDTDEQLMIFVPFQASLKIHTLQFTSLPSTSSNDDDETPMRPKKIHLFSNRAHNLGFEEAEDIEPSQVIELAAKDWNEETGTANVELRYVRFQKVTSLVIFVVSGDGDAEKVRLDRIRVIGETGEKRAMGKLEKAGGNDS